MERGVQRIGGRRARGELASAELLWTLAPEELFRTVALAKCGERQKEEIKTGISQRPNHVH
eukprot:394069-Pyramimonas_sp.AAC.1